MNTQSTMPQAVVCIAEAELEIGGKTYQPGNKLPPLPEEAITELESLGVLFRLPVHCVG